MNYTTHCVQLVRVRVSSARAERAALAVYHSSGSRRPPARWLGYVQPNAPRRHRLEQVGDDGAEPRAHHWQGVREQGAVEVGPRGRAADRPRLHGRGRRAVGLAGLPGRVAVARLADYDAAAEVVGQLFRLGLVDIARVDVDLGNVDVVRRLRLWVNCLCGVWGHFRWFLFGRHVVLDLRAITGSWNNNQK